MGEEWHPKMTEEAEVEIIEPGPASKSEALVEITFQKNLSCKEKYLEAEPKALGITQIMVSFFYVSCKFVTWEKMQNQTEHIVTASISSVGIIAGSVAIAAQFLHLPTLKACLGMQIVTCIVSVVCFLTSWGLLLSQADWCWEYHNSTSQPLICDRLMSVYDHLVAIELLGQAAQIALSATLAAFCCKVIQCCSPRTSEPMVVVNAPSTPE